MKIKLIFIVLISILLFTGCKKEEVVEVDENLENGKIALENEKYEEAIDLFSKSLEENNQSDETRNLYIQSMKLQKIVKYKDQKQYKDALDEVELLLEVDNKSSKTTDLVKSLKNELEKLDEEKSKNEETRKANARYIAKVSSARLIENAKAEHEKMLAEKEKEEKEKEENDSEDKVTEDENEEDDKA